MTVPPVIDRAGIAPSGALTIADALALWSDFRSGMVALGSVAASTHANQLAIVKHLGAALGGLSLEKVPASQIEIYAARRRQTCAAVTVRGELNVLRQVLNWCLGEHMAVTKPRLPTVKVPATDANLPSDEAFLWALANSPTRMATALEFMMLTGLSPHELERVQVRDLRTDLPPPYSASTLGIGQRNDFAVKQDSRRRWVPLNPAARHLWDRSASDRQAIDHLFPRVDAMQKAVVRMRQRAVETGVQIPIGADQITPKLMRKWFASHLASGGTPEHVLQRLMGHAPGSPITRRHYVRSNEIQITEATTTVAIERNKP